MASNRPVRTTVNTGTNVTPDLETLQRASNAEVEHKETVRKTLADHYKSEEKVMVTGAPMYRAQFGNSMTISINGIAIYVPLDGGRYNIPESFAQVFNARIRSVNEEIEMQRQRGDVHKNKEDYPGAIDLIQRVQ